MILKNKSNLNIKITLKLNPTHDLTSNPLRVAKKLKIG